MAKRKILVVDDEKDFRQIVADFLSSCGYEVKTGSDGAEAVALAGSFLPDLIICDVMMPVKNGFQVCRELRAKGARIPFIFLTFKGNNTDEVEGWKSGGDDYIIKPLDLDLFKTKVASILEKTRP